MGTSLVIKNADFRQNGIPSQPLCLLGISDSEFNNCPSITSTGSSYPFVFTEQFSLYALQLQYRIIGIRLKIAQAGVIPIYVANFKKDAGINIDSNYQLKENLNIREDMVGNICDIYFQNPILLQTNQKIVFGSKTAFSMTAKWYYGLAGTSYPNLCIMANDVNNWVVSSLPLFVDYIIDTQ